MSAVILIDGNSVGHASNAAARLSVGDLETQAIYGTINAIRDLMLKYVNHTPICLWDGRAQWRYDLYPEYKGKRKLDPNKIPKPYEIQQQKMRDSYYKQRPHIVEALDLLGVRQVIPQHDEADDLAGYLAKSYSKKGKKVILVSRDHDWLQLVDDNVTWFNPVDNQTVTQKTFQEYTGYKDPRQFVAEKCLVGDSSDNIKGVSGIGEKAANLLLNHYGYVHFLFEEFEDLGIGWKPPTEELRRYKKKLLEFIAEGSEGRDIYDRNHKLMSLLDKEKQTNVKVIRNSLREADFVEFCHEFAFQSIIRKLDEWLSPFKTKELSCQQ
jgi:5'-3' exonuclease